jgi:tetratricopeptide (TPR) repeat protein
MAEAAPTCPSENEIVAFAADPSGSPAIAAHVEACETCRVTVAEVAALAGQSASQGVAEQDPAPDAPLARGARVGRYVVLETVGVGAMGTVYAAYDPELDRRIALKVLRADLCRGPNAETLRERLVREARVMARLSHPEIIAVHDAGTFGDQVFLAMELAGEGTLASFLADEPRTFREILDVFLRAGRGLAAAHAAGLVHRDFKPENVLVGKDGRVRVTDFGLARAEASEPADHDVSAVRPRDDDPQLTAAGALVGTPAYMAPEQHRGERADARSDQFAFCVALYRALYGEPPFAGASARELAEVVAAGAVREAPRGSRVPARVRRVLLRGLSVRPEARYPSMDALLADLARDPARTRRWALAGAAVVALVGAAAVSGWSARARAPVCEGGDAKLAGVWDAARREEVHRAFGATGLPYAESSFQGAARALDGWTRAWSAMHRDACLATRVRGEQSEDLLARRMACLSRRLDKARAVVDLFAARADATVVEHAIEAAEALPALSECADTAALLAPVPPPRKEDAPRVEALIRRIDEADALDEAHRYEEASRVADEVLREARAIGYGKLVGEAEHQRAMVEAHLRHPREAEEAFLEAVWAAEGAHDDLRVLAAWSNMLFWLATESRFEEAHRVARHAEAALARVGGGEALAADLDESRGRLAYAEGKYAESTALLERDLAYRERQGALTTSLARAHWALGDAANGAGDPARAAKEYREAVRVYEAALGPLHPTALAARINLASALRNQGRPIEAIPELEALLPLAKAGFGDESYQVAVVSENLGACMNDVGRMEEALDLTSRALRITEKNLGPDREETASMRMEVGAALAVLGRYEASLAEIRRGLAVIEARLGPDHPAVVIFHANLGITLFQQGKPDEALAEARRALAVAEKAIGTDSAAVVLPLATIGDALQQKRRYPEALAAYERAVTVGEKTLGKEHPILGVALLGIGNVLLAQGAADRAVAPVERSLGIRQKGDPADRADAELVLAEARWRLGERDRARELARAASEDDVRAGHRAERGLAAARAWIAAHP